MRPHSTPTDILTDHNRMAIFCNAWLDRRPTVLTGQLMLVCQRWRVLAFEYPLLFLVIDVRIMTHGSYAYLVQILSGSRSVPLHVSINFDVPQRNHILMGCPYVNTEKSVQAFMTTIVALKRSSFCHKSPARHGNIYRGQFPKVLQVLSDAQRTRPISPRLFEI
jgi:hypothetical protein